jgi:hypothetical protein
VRGKLNQKTLRECQTQAFEALSDYYAKGGTRAACVMSVGAGKTALGVAASLAFARRRALVVTPGNVIRGVFDKAFDHTVSGHVLFGLPGGPLIPGSPPPKVLTLDREEGTIRSVSREDLLSADPGLMIVLPCLPGLGSGRSAAGGGDNGASEARTQDGDNGKNGVLPEEAAVCKKPCIRRSLTYGQFANFGFEWRV